jgi:hypothetical protein
MAYDPASGMNRLLAERLGMTEEQLDQMGADGWMPDAAADPVAATVMRWLAQQRGTGQPSARTQHDRALEQARLAINALQQHLREANARTERIAEALGACGACWGSAPNCPRCGGEGRPGYAHPMKQQLLELVSPALAKLRLTIVDAGPETGPQGGDGHYRQTGG